MSDIVITAAERERLELELSRMSGEAGTTAAEHLDWIGIQIERIIEGKEAQSAENRERLLSFMKMLMIERERYERETAIANIKRLVREQRAAGNSYANFIRKFWSTVEPGTRFITNWHIDAISDHFEALVSRDIRNLVVNIPPRFSKSTLLTVMPAPWVWMIAPQMRFMFGTYSQKLGRRDSVKSRDIIMSTLYQEAIRSAFTLKKDQNTKDRFENTQNGYRAVVPVGSGTGEGADMFGIDDPIDATKANSDAYLQQVIDWFDGTVSTRGNDMNAVAWLVMQRLSEKDLSGHIVAQELGYEQLVLPMEFDPKRVCTTSIGFTDPRTRSGELLWPERFPRKYVDQQKRKLRHRYAGQYQQRPVEDGGGLFKLEWIKVIDDNPILSNLRWVRYWDLAYSKKERSSRSATLSGAIDKRGNVYIRRGWADRLESPELKRQMRKMMLDEINVRHGIEAKVHGMPTVQEFREDRELLPVSIVPVQIPRYDDKVVRAQAPADRMEERRVFFVRESAADQVWIDALTDELLVFPLGATEDLVDCLSGVFMMLSLNKQVSTAPPSVGAARNTGVIVPAGRSGTAGIYDRLPGEIGAGKLPRDYGR